MTLDALSDLITRADLRMLARQTTIIPYPVPAGFTVSALGELLLEPTLIHDPVLLRHGLELSLLRRLWPDRPVLAGFAAARTAALFAALERPVSASRLAGRDPLAETAPPDDADCAAVWLRLARHQPGAPVTLPPAALAALRRVWPLLGPAEWLMQTGGDHRLAVDPATGLNAYGCSHRPRPWAVTFASSTASSSSERGYDGAEASRHRVLRAAAWGDHGVGALLDDIRRELAALYALPADATVALAPSGTDCELFALAAVQSHPAECPLTVVLVAPEETGSGVPLATAGCHFAIDTAHGAAAKRGTLIEGFRGDTLIEAVALRDGAGAIRDPAAVAADCTRLAEAAVAAGRRVMMHLVDVSKTGLLAPEPGVLQAVQDRHPGAVDIVVDACQARLGARRVREYLRRGWIVLLTGSKFLTGPPFCGAAIFPGAMRARLDRPLPVGLRDYSGRAEWPCGLPAAAALEARGNFGLALRWSAALAELRAFDAVPDAVKRDRLQGFVGRVQAAVASNPNLMLIAAPPLGRAGPADTWDQVGSIVSFAMRQPGAGQWLDFASARQVYAGLNADISDALPGGLPPGHVTLAQRRFHAGQPVRLSLAGQEVGVMRMSAGARLVSGEPSHAALKPADRLDREAADAEALLEKISLILRHWATMQRAVVRATYL